VLSVAYQFDHQWEKERLRLAALERAFDPCSQRSILAIDAQRGWRCLEVGGGGGSMAEWLCRVIAPDGVVVATDLETGFLEAIGAPNLEVRQHDIVNDPLEEGGFDLVHSRAVLDHLPERDAVLGRLLRALRPGGWLTLDGADFSSVHAVGIPTRDALFFDESFAKVIQVSRGIGMDPAYGRRLGSLFREAGLVNVVNEGTVVEWAHDDPLALFFSMTFERLRPAVVEQGVLSTLEHGRLVAMMTSPGFHAISNTVFTARGQLDAA
jgi:SAM-dependent methyltransferase